MSKNLNTKLPVSNAKDQAIQALLKRAEGLIADKEIDQALTLLEEAEATYADSPQIPHFIGKTLSDHKNPMEGAKKLEATLKLFPDHLASLLDLGSIYLKPGDTKRANPFFRKAMEIAPENPSVHINMGALNQRKGNLPLAVENYRKGIELQLKYPITKEGPPEKDDFRITDAENLLWDTLKLMADNGVHMFPIAGTLLGLVRDGALFTHDKDIDTGIPHSEMSRTIQIMQKNGWTEINNSFGFICPRAMLHLETKITMDISGFLIDKEKEVALGAGVWAHGVPKEWNILREFDQINLIKRDIPKKEGKVWFLREPEKWLVAMYGDSWRIPDKNYDTMIRSKNVRSFSYLLQCFSYARIYSSWTKNKIPLALGLVHSTLERTPNDPLMQKVLKSLQLKRKQILK